MMMRLPWVRPDIVWTEPTGMSILNAIVSKPLKSEKQDVSPTPSASPVASGIRDNYRRGTAGDFLRAKIAVNSRLSVVSAYFTIYAFDALKDRLSRIDHLDFLFGEPRFINALDPDRTEKKAFLIDPAGLHLVNTLEQKRVARECADWIRCRIACEGMTAETATPEIAMILSRSRR